MVHSFKRLTFGFLLSSVLASAAVVSQSSRPNPQPPPAFPTAQGFGALATGGRGGDTFAVTNLNDSGPGSFRDAVSKSRRVVIFNVGGIIRLKSNVPVSGDITIAGQSAPGEGIVLY